MWRCIFCRASNQRETCRECGAEPVTDPIERAIYFRSKQAECNAKADAMPKYVRFNAKGKPIVKPTFEEKQLRRRAGGYARAASDNERLALV
jgi:hypothetical protein